jgi:Ca2+-transporting ATPase
LGLIGTLFRGYDEPRTMAFCTIVFFQLFNAMNARSREYSIFKIGFFRNKYLVIGIIASFILNISIIYVPIFQQLFEITPITPYDWLVVFLVSSSVLVIEEIRKALAPTLFTGSSVPVSKK